MNTPREFGFTLLIPAIVGGLSSALIEWHFWHGFAFTMGLLTLVYSATMWIGADLWVRLETPVIDLPIVLCFGAILWYANMQLHDFRPVTALIQILTFAPFAASVLFALLRLE